ncbi:MAG: hypothetical protein PUF33_00465 [Solobacterium sp.]|nr:hypothetical protein [Solobacterium sp.]
MATVIYAYTLKSQDNIKKNLKNEKGRTQRISDLGRNQISRNLPGLYRLL